MNRFKTILLLVSLTLIALGMGGCESPLDMLLGNSDGRTLEPVDSQSPDSQSAEPAGTQALTTANGGQVLQNEAAGIEIELPASWSQTNRLNNAAQLQAADSENQLYMIVVAEDAEPLMRLGLQENAQKYRALLAQELAVYDGESPTDVAFVGENFATQYEMRGRLANETPVVYLHTTVLSDDRYYQIVGWTTPEQYSAYRSELQTIADSFREIGS